MSYKSREERARASRGAQQANSQRPGGADVDPRQRRASEAELQTAQRIGPGQEVDNGGRQNVRTDQTIRIDRRNRHQVNADKLRFETPVEGSQAATKDYVDTAIGDIVIIGDSEYVVEYNRPPTGPSISTTTSWKPAPTEYLYDHNNTVSPSNPAAVYAVITHTGTGDECVYLYPGYVYGIALSLRCYQSAFELGLLYSATIGATAWNVYPGSVRFTELGDSTTVYLLLDNTAGGYTYVTPAFRRYQTGTAIVSTVRMHARRLHPHYNGGYAALPLPGLPDAPEAGFEAESATLLAFRNELFSNLSTGDVTSVVWDFGDRYTPGVALHGSTERNPVYRYEAGGTFPVSITATGDGGSDTHTANVTVQDVVCTENLLGSVSNTSVSGSLLDISNWQGSGWTASTSAIAAPDGTLTATDLTTAGSFSLIAKLTESTASTWELGSSYVEAATVTASIYIYRPSVAAALNFIIFTGTPASPVERVYVNFNSSLQVVFFLSLTTGAHAYTAERNLWIEDIGSTGWARITASLYDFDSSSQELNFWPLYSSGASVTAWSPELRYGDWVARGKNWLDNDALGMALFPSGTTSALSSTPAPDGTLSAVDLVSTNPSYTFVNWYDTAAFNGTVPQGSRITWEFYMKHPMYGSGGDVQLFLQAGAVTTERVKLVIQKGGGFDGTIPINISAGPGYTIANCGQAEAIGSDGWWRYRLSLIDYAGTVTNVYASTGHDGVAGDIRSTVWNPRITVGNPADYETVLPFVSGPQNLLGDGSDYDPATSNWVSAYPPTLTANSEVAPNGRLEADTLQHYNSPGASYLNFTTSSVVVGSATYYKFYYKIDSSIVSNIESVTYKILGPRSVLRESISLQLNYGSSTPISVLTSTTTGGPGYSTSDVEVTEVSNDWVRISIRLFDYSSDAQYYQVQHYRLATGVPYTLWGSEVTTIDPLDPV